MRSNDAQVQKASDCNFSLALDKSVMGAVSPSAAFVKAWLSRSSERGGD